MNKNLLYSKNLTVGYSKSAIVGNINISIKNGEITTIIGPNGSGKSTILKSIAAQLKPIDGMLFLGGRDIRKMKEKDIAKTLSFLMTGKIQTELMSCGEVVESGRYPYTGTLGILSKEDKDIVNFTMDLTQISNLKDKDFSCISDGQRQRVMLARAICQEPKILVLDEPTSFLDIKYKLELLDMLKKLVKEKNIGVLMSLHELDLAQKISDRIICVSNGKISGMGTPEDIFSSDYIENLYGISTGKFNCIFGSVELAAPLGEPEVFVIGGGGEGINVYRQLQRKNIPFAAGIVHKNDIEYPVAKALASSVVSEEAFEEISETSISKAIEIIEKCRKVICCVNHFGTMNMKCKQLIKVAGDKLEEKICLK